ncbi:hypothetical protein PSY31_23675, partial [Shigella flexneri]|nr:hypothetical protein [Shigella flexneri]
MVEENVKTRMKNWNQLAAGLNQDSIKKALTSMDAAVKNYLQKLKGIEDHCHDLQSLLTEPISAAIQTWNFSKLMG